MKLRSKFESKIYKQLKRAKVKFKYESERVAYILARHYIPDFIIDTPTGKLYVETKGYLRRDDKSKLIAVRRYNPQIDLRILFMSHYNKKDERWAQRNGFRYAFETIPKDWLKGL